MAHDKPLPCPICRNHLVLRGDYTSETAWNWWQHEDNSDCLLAEVKLAAPFNGKSSEIEKWNLAAARATVLENALRNQREAVLEAIRYSRIGHDYNFEAVIKAIDQALLPSSGESLMGVLRAAQDVKADTRIDSDRYPHVGYDGVCALLRMFGELAKLEGRDAEECISAMMASD